MAPTKEIDSGCAPGANEHVAFPRNIPVELERKNTSKLSLVLSGKEIIKALAKVGFVPVSHVF